MIRPLLVLAWLVLAVAACGSAPPPVAPPTATRGVDSAEPTPTLTPIPPTPTVDVGPLSPVFGTPWGDRSVYAANLVSSEQPVLDALPGATVYHIDLAIGPELSTLVGRQAVFYTNRTDVTLTELYFHVYPVLLDGYTTTERMTVDGSPVIPELDTEAATLRVVLDPPLPPDAHTVVAFDLQVTVPITTDGYYGTFGAGQGVLSLPHFYPTVAAYDADGWNLDVPAAHGDLLYADASFYLVRLNAPTSLVVAASGSAVAEQTDGDRRTVTYAAGPARDFYVAAAADYVVSERQVGETTVRSYAPGSADAARTRVLDVAAAALAVFNDYLGPYPYREFEVVSAPTTALGVEFPGIVMLADRLYAADSETPDTVVEAVVAHEAAHQWFYNVVGNDQRDEPWLDESLTQYATWVYFRATQGAGGDNGFRQSLLDRWSRVEQEPVPIDLPVSAYDARAYSAIVYGRGPLVVDAVAQAMGQAQFDAMLRDYVAAYRWGIATGAVWVDSAESHCQCDLSPVIADALSGRR